MSERASAGNAFRCIFVDALPAKISSPALLATARADIDQMIRRANDRLFVLHHEERVPFVAQIVHHADEPPDVARMQTRHSVRP